MDCHREMQQGRKAVRMGNNKSDRNQNISVVESQKTERVKGEQAYLQQVEVAIMLAVVIHAKVLDAHLICTICTQKLSLS
jgi:hypothetical protein